MLLGMDTTAPISDVSGLFSPALVVRRDAVKRNIARMLEIAGGPGRLRPHVKTHKMPDVIRLAESLGVRKHKVATIAEAEMVAEAGGTDVLVAYPLVGPNCARLRALAEKYPRTTFSALVDSPEGVNGLSQAFADAARALPVLIDLDVGMGRTGIAPGPDAIELAGMIRKAEGLALEGLHSYDGHVRDADPAGREETARRGTWAPTLAIWEQLRRDGVEVARIIVGGTPTFPIHAKLRQEGVVVECSPGTTVLHDYGYSSKFPDLPFEWAAWLLTRVISRTGKDRITLDLGHKAVAADPVGARVFLPEIPDAKFVGHSEEHLVVETPRAGEFPPGTPLWGIPAHVCPTVALHEWAEVAEDGVAVGRWPIPSRRRVLTV
jgi:D-serine deaminase-like pyridoxal phosphate-dependent protein